MSMLETINQSVSNSLADITSLILIMSVAIFAFWLGKRAGKKNGIRSGSGFKASKDAKGGFRFFWDKLERFLNNIMEQFQKRLSLGRDLQPGRLGTRKGQNQQQEQLQEQNKEKFAAERSLLRLLERALLLGRTMGVSPEFPALAAAQAAIAYNAQASQIQAASQLAANIAQTGIVSPTHRLSPLGINHDAHMAAQLASRITVGNPSLNSPQARHLQLGPAFSLFTPLSQKIFGPHSHAAQNLYVGLLANTLSQLLKLGAHVTGYSFSKTDFGAEMQNKPQKEPEMSRTPTSAEAKKTPVPERQSEQSSSKSMQKTELTKTEASMSSPNIEVIFASQSPAMGITISATPMVTMPTLNVQTVTITNVQTFTQQRFDNVSFGSQLSQTTTQIGQTTRL